jgi:hypothetical protein
VALRSSPIDSSVRTSPQLGEIRSLGGFEVRTRRLAAAAAVTVSAASMLPLTAHADTTTGTTIYVNVESKSCTDSGTGAQAAPFCSLQAGVDAATPGTTVLVAKGAYTPVTITRSGTAAEPITISAASWFAEVVVPDGTAGTAFTFTNASYVTVSGFGVGTPQNAYINGSSHITLDRLNAGTELYETMPGIEVTGSSSFVTLSRDQVGSRDRTAPEIQVDPGSANDVITTNAVVEGGAPPILVTSAPGIDITSNTVETPGSYMAIDLAGASTGSYVENNVLAPNDLAASTSTPFGLLTVSTASTPGTTVDYNVLGVRAPENGSAYYPYQWGSQFYPTAAAFTAATGQAAHDFLGGPGGVAYRGGFALAAPGGSAIVNTANSAAPGELPTDIDGNARSDDPLFPATGAGPYSYYDCGAAQILPTTATDTLTAVAVGALGATATSQNWSSTGYSFNFGDGTGAANGSYGGAKHTYAKPGTYTITVSGTSVATGQPFTDSTSFTTTALGGGHLFDTSRSSGGVWQTWDQGPPGSTGIAQGAATAMPDDDVQVVAVTSGGTLEHTVYSSTSGTWQNWGVPKNNTTPVSASIAGMPDGSSQLIEVTSTGALEHTIRYANGSWQSSGWGSPAGSTGIAEAAITAMPNGSSQLVAVTTSGALEHNIRNANGSWQGWRALTQPGVTVTDASIAGMPNGSSQIIEVTSTGVLRHDIRNANGTWQPQGWGSPTGSTGIAEASITAVPNGSTQFVAVTTSGALEHNIRNANGTWQSGGWGAPAQTDLAAAVASSSIAGRPDGSAQIIEISAN